MPPYRPLLAGLCLLFAATGSGSGEEPGARTSRTLEVTASRLPQPPDAVPAAITVIDGDELRERGVTDLREALWSVGGVDIAPGGDQGPAAAVPEMWGLRERDAFLLVVDGVPWGGAFNPALATLDLHDIERIEILRGPAPVMYGATSFTGVIQVVHRAPADAATGGLAGFASYQSGGGSLTTRLPGWLGLDSSLSVDGDRQGFSDDRTSFRRGHARWRNRGPLGGGLLRLDLDLSYVDQDPASPHPRQGPGLSPAVPLDSNHNPDGAYLDHRRLTLTGGFERPTAAGDFTATASLGRSREDTLRGFLADLAAPEANASGFRQRTDLTDVYLDAHLVVREGDWNRRAHLEIVAGADYLHGSADSIGSAFDYTVGLDGADAPPAGDLAYGPAIGLENERDFLGLYGFVAWSPAAALRVEGGLRLNRTAERRAHAPGPREEGDAIPVPLAAQPPPDGTPMGGIDVSLHHTEVRPSGTIGLSYTAWESGTGRLTLYAAYRDAFKPAAADLSLGEAGAGAGGGLLDPETARSGELGVKARLLGGRLDVSAGLFRMDLRNLVVARSVGGLPAFENAGEVRLQGCEIEGTWRFAAPYALRAGYAFHDSRLRDYRTELDGVPTELGGKRVELSPRHLASLDLQRAPGHGLGGLVSLAWVGERYLNKRNTALTPSYAEWSAGLTWREGPWLARLEGRNLGDERPPVSESELGDSQYYRLPARRVDLSVARRF